MATKTTTEADNPREGMTAGELRAALQGVADTATITARVTMGGKLKSITVASPRS
jgi:hypothetical protein